ncbi:hypothetical protein PAMP_016256 [Pampus punctatissimus]
MRGVGKQPATRVTAHHMAILGSTTKLAAKKTWKWKNTCEDKGEKVLMMRAMEYQMEEGLCRTVQESGVTAATYNAERIQEKARRACCGRSGLTQFWERIP